MIGFILWAIVGVFFIGLGIFSFFSKKATGFWANAEMFEVDNVQKYNHAMGKLWTSYGIIFIILGLPLLGGQNSPFILISCIGVLVELIVFMIIYTLIIEKKYRKH